MILSILCYVPLSVELLGPMTPPVFKPKLTAPQFSNHIDASFQTILMLLRAPAARSNCHMLNYGSGNSAICYCCY